MSDPETNDLMDEELTEEQDTTSDGARPPKRKRQIPRTQDQKCEDTLRQMNVDRISVLTLLKYICTNRHELHIKNQWSHVTKFINELAEPAADGMPAEQSVPFSLSEWRRMFKERGLWKIGAELLRKELNKIADLNEIRGNVDLENEKERWQHTAPIIPTDKILTLAPQTIQLLHSLCQPKERLQRRTEIPEVRVSFLITSILYTQRHKTCSTVPVAMGAFMLSNGLSRRGIEMLNRVGVCCGYARVKNLHDEQLILAQDEVRDLRQNPCLNITIDNFDLADGVNDQRLGDHGNHLSATTVLANQGVAMPPDGLKQSMLNPDYRVEMNDLLQGGFRDVDTIKKVSGRSMRFYGSNENGSAKSAADTSLRRLTVSIDLVVLYLVGDSRDFLR
jgi:hypothetical protein